MTKIRQIKKEEVIKGLENIKRLLYLSPRCFGKSTLIGILNDAIYLIQKEEIK